MARFLVWSDLHDAVWGGFDLPDLSTPVDGVLIAGDTHTMGRHLDIPAQAARKYGCPVALMAAHVRPWKLSVVQMNSYRSLPSTACM